MVGVARLSERSERGAERGFDEQRRDDHFLRFLAERIGEPEPRGRE
jgi:hypothetical protein